MIDQVRQGPNSFEGKYRDYHIFMRITPEGHNLQIKIENKATLEQFFALIDHQYIASQNDFVNIFEEPVDILGYFIHHFQEVTIDHESIRIRYEYGTIRRVAKNFTFKTKKIEMDPLEFADLKMERIKETFAAQMSEKDKRINQLEAKLKAQDQKFHQALKAYAQRNNELARTAEDLNNQNRRLIKALTRLNQENEVKDSLLERLNQINAQKQEKYGRRPSIFHNRWVKIEKISPGMQNINVLAKIVTYEVMGRRVLVELGDETGTVKAFLFANIMIKNGDTIALTNAEAAVYKEHIQLQLLQNGRVDQVKFEIEDLNMENDISLKEWVEQA